MPWREGGRGGQGSTAQRVRRGQNDLQSLFFDFLESFSAEFVEQTLSLDALSLPKL